MGFAGITNLRLKIPETPAKTGENRFVGVVTNYESVLVSGRMATAKPHAYRPTSFASCKGCGASPCFGSTCWLGRGRVVGRSNVVVEIAAVLIVRLVQPRCQRHREFHDGSAVAEIAPALIIGLALARSAPRHSRRRRAGPGRAGPIHRRMAVPISSRKRKVVTAGNKGKLGFRSSTGERSESRPTSMFRQSLRIYSGAEFRRGVGDHSTISSVTSSFAPSRT